MSMAIVHQPQNSMTVRQGVDDAPTEGIAYLTWMAGFMGFCGIHRFYLGKYFTGALWLLTGGLLGIGQFIDLFRIKKMVRLERRERLAHLALAEKEERLLGPHSRGLLPEDPRVALTKAAAQKGGHLSVTQGVMAVGKPFEEVEKILDDMARSGYVTIDNDEDTGVVIYRFTELQ